MGPSASRRVLSTQAPSTPLPSGLRASVRTRPVVLIVTPDSSEIRLAKDRTTVRPRRFTTTTKTSKYFASKKNRDFIVRKRSSPSSPSSSTSPSSSVASASIPWAPQFPIRTVAFPPFCLCPKCCHHHRSPGTNPSLSRITSSHFPHTLILGSHPSVTSLQQQQYYAHPLNAFWWIAGDCLGFRRDQGISPSTGQPYALTQHVRCGPEAVLTYPQQLECLGQHGFVLWDIVQSCHRPGSLDQDIQDEVAADIPPLVAQHPGLVRIVLANGGTGASLFRKHLTHWLVQAVDVHFVAAPDPYSQKAFGKVLSRRPSSTQDPPERTITLVSALSVSPAAASYSYQAKRDFWERHVYQPGLAMYHDRVKLLATADSKPDGVH